MAERSMTWGRAERPPLIAPAAAPTARTTIPNVPPPNPMGGSHRQGSTICSRNNRSPTGPRVGAPDRQVGLEGTKPERLTLQPTPGLARFTKATFAKQARSSCTRQPPSPTGGTPSLCWTRPRRRHRTRPGYRSCTCQNCRMLGRCRCSQKKPGCPFPARGTCTCGPDGSSGRQSGSGP